MTPARTSPLPAVARAGVATAGWFDDQVALGLLGHMLLLGWEKALGGPGAELTWWADAVERGDAAQQDVIQAAIDTSLLQGH